MSPLLLTILTSYLLGSIPFGLLLTKLAGLGDIRAIGSGNIGATNVLRTGKKGLAALTLILDGVKGLVAVLIIKHFYPDYALIAAVFALLGHLFSVWLKFKGGKGVATSAGVLLALHWPIGLTCILVWVLIAVISRYSSLAALTAAAMTPVEAYIFDRPDLFPLTALIIILLFWTHRANIRRLLARTEPKIGHKS